MHAVTLMEECEALDAGRSAPLPPYYVEFVYPEDPRRAGWSDRDLRAAARGAGRAAGAGRRFGAAGGERAVGRGGRRARRRLPRLAVGLDGGGRYRSSRLSARVGNVTTTTRR